MKNYALLGIALTLRLLDVVYAQILTPVQNSKHLFQTQVGYDYNLVSLQIGYQRYIEDVRVSFGTDLTQGTALLGTSNLRWRMGTSFWLINSEKYLMKSSADFVVANSKNLAGTYTGTGFDVRLQGGLKFSKNGLIGFDFEYNPFISTFIQHSDYFLNNYLSTAKDGWYKLSAQNLRLGGIFTFQIGEQKKSEIGLRGGFQSSGQFDKLIPGFYTQLLFSTSL